MHNVEPLLRNLAVGCPDHPAYRYKRAPAACVTCAQLFIDKQRLTELDAANQEQIQKEKIDNEAWDDWRDSLASRS